MILRVLAGVTTILPSGATLRLNWAYQGTGGANALAYSSNNITYTEAIPVNDADQVGIYLFPSGAGGSISVPVVARIQWSPDANAAIGGSSFFVEEKLEQPNPVVGNYQQFNAVIKEWGPNQGAWTIWRPVTALYMKLGLYSSNYTTTGDTVTTFIVLQRSDQLQVSGT